MSESSTNNTNTTNNTNEVEKILNALLEREQEREAEYSRKMQELEVAELVRSMQDEAEALRAEYPEFDPEAELEGDVFRQLMQSGLDMKTAYEAVHLAELKEKAKAEANAKADEIRQGAEALARKKYLRPDEIGSQSVSSSSPAYRTRGVSALSKKQRADLARRSQLGEVIKL